MNEIRQEKLVNALGPEWFKVLGSEFEKPYMNDIIAKISAVKAKKYEVFPKKEDIFNAFSWVQPSKIKVVILGQDPYPHAHAHGLAFSTTESTAPASLRNIFKEIEDEYGPKELYDSGAPETDNCLEGWAMSGVFLLNTVLTVTGGYANSHSDFGWQQFTGEAIHHISRLDQPVVWMLWGNSAQQSYDMYGTPSSKHLVLRTSHPSPLSVSKGFKGCGHFKKCDQFLTKNNLDPISWSLRKLPF